MNKAAASAVIIALPCYKVPFSVSGEALLTARVPLFIGKRAAFADVTPICYLLLLN